MEGLYALTTNQMQLVGRNLTNTVMTSAVLSQVTLSANHWYQVDATFANQGNNQILYTGSFFDLGTDGTSIPTSLATWNWSYENDPMASSNSVYAGFSALANGGIARADNFGVPISQTPLPATLSLFASGLVGLGLLGWRRKRRA